MVSKEDTAVLGLRKIRRAIISVSDKSGLQPLIDVLVDNGVELVSTGGTKKAIAGFAAPVRDVSDLTGFPEMMDGRLKTLHPLVHGGLLAIRENTEHVAAMKAHNIVPVDLLVVNLYPFEETLRSGAPFGECVENIDIGGPARIRAAAKNHRDVVVIVGPSYYPELLKELERYNGSTTITFRQKCFARAFEHTANYDRHIADWTADQFL